MSTNPFTDLLNVFGPTGRHWLKGLGFVPDTDSYCLSSGMCKTRLWHDYKARREAGNILASIILQEFPERVPSDSRTTRDPHVWRIVIAFNDHDDTTWADTRMLLEKARARWDETHS